MRVIEIHGFNFGVENDGWLGHDNECDWAIDDLIGRMEALPASEIEAIHANLTAFEAGDADEMDEADSLCAAAVSSATTDWRPSLCLVAE